jgi:hypothetical protein
MMANRPGRKNCILRFDSLGVANDGIDLARRRFASLPDARLGRCGPNSRAGITHRGFFKCSRSKVSLSIRSPFGPSIFRSCPLGDSPAASLLRVVEQKPVAEIDDQTLTRADIGRKAIAEVKQAAAGLLQRTLPTDRAEALAEKLATGTWTHDDPILGHNGEGAKSASSHRHAERSP